jgi:hypothetical protein
MAGSLISTGLLKIIPNRHAENAKKLRKPPFADFQGYFRGHERGLKRWNIASGSLACLSQAQLRRLP